jgi:putative colanic acid biosynthesis acetyltransferase WcaF
MQKTKLYIYNNYPFAPGASLFKRLLWHYINAMIFKTGLLPVSNIKVLLLRLFGANIGNGVVIKPCVNIKYPWHLRIGDHTWLGENVWIDCLELVNIGSNVCISQGAVLLTGSHDYKRQTFDLITGTVTLEDGTWIGALAVVNQGITVASHAILTAGSVATKNLEAYSIYQGNPAVKVRSRTIN